MLTFSSLEVVAKPLNLNSIKWKLVNILGFRVKPVSYWWASRSCSSERPAGPRPFCVLDEFDHVTDHVTGNLKKHVGDFSVSY